MKVANYDQMMAYLKDPFNPSELRARVKELEQKETFESRMDFDKGGTAKLVSYVESLPKGSTVTTKMLEDYISKNKLKVNLRNFINRKAKNIKNVKFDTSYGGSRFTDEQRKNIENWKKNNPNKNYDDLSTEAKTRVRKGQNVGSLEVTQKEKYADAYKEAYKFYKSKGLEPDAETIRKTIAKNDGKFVPPTRKLKGEAGLTGLLKNYEMDDLLKDLKQGKNLAEISIEYFDKNEKEVLKSLEGKRDYTKPLGRISTDLSYAISRNKEATKLYNKIKKQQSFDRLKNKNKYLKEVETLLPFAQEQGLVPEINPFNGKKIDTGSKYFQFAYKMKRDPIAKLFGFYEKVGVEHPAGVARALIFDDPATLNEIVATMPDTNIASGSTYDAYATGQARFFEKTGDPKYIKKINQIILNKQKEFGKPRTILDVEGDNVTRRATDFSLTNPNYFKDAKSFINEYIAAGGSNRKNFNKLDSNLQKAIKLYEKGNQVEGNKNLKIAVNTILDKEQRIVKFINEYENSKGMLAKDLSEFCNIQKKASGTGSLACSPDEITRNMKKAATTEAGKARVLKAARAAGKVFGTIVAPVDIAIETALMAPHLLRGDVQGAIAASTAGFFGAGRDEIEEAEKEYGKDSPLYNLYQRDKAIGDMAMHINKMDRLSGTLKKLIPSEGEITSFSTIDDPRARTTKESYLQQTLNDFIEEAKNKPKIQESFNLYAPKINTPALQFQALDQAYKLSDKIQSSGYYKPDKRGQYPLLQRLQSAGIKDLQTTFTKKDIEDRYSDMKLYDTGAAPLYKDVTDRTFPYKASELAEREKSQMPSEEEVEKRFRRNLGEADPKLVQQYEQMGFPQLTPFLGYANGGRINFANGGRLTFSDGSPKDPSKRSTLKKIGIGGGVAGGLATGLINLLDLFRGGSKVTKAQEAVRRASRAEEIFFDLVRNVKNKGVMREATFTADEPGGVIYEHAGVKVIDEAPYIRVEFETDKGAPAVIEYRKPGRDVDPDTKTVVDDPGGFEYEGQEVGRIRPNGDVDIDFEEEIIDEITNVEKIAKGD